MYTSTCNVQHFLLCRHKTSFSFSLNHIMISLLQILCKRFVVKIMYSSFWSDRYSFFFCLISVCFVQAGSLNTHGFRNTWTLTQSYHFYYILELRVKVYYIHDKWWNETLTFFFGYFQPIERISILSTYYYGKELKRIKRFLFYLLFISFGASKIL